MRKRWMLGWSWLVLVAADAPPPAPLTEAMATGVLGRMVHDADGRDIGRIVDVVVDPSGQARAIVVDVGGFMGVGTRRVAVSWSSVHVPPPGAPQKWVDVDMTDKQISSAPGYNDRSKPAVIVGPAVADGQPKPADAPDPGK